MVDFTVCVLLYGDYPQLADNVLGSLRRFVGQYELRLGCNEISQNTLAVIRTYMREWQDGGIIDHSGIYDAPTNIRKYPMMRRMWYERPITTPYIMWFDDDSWILPDAPHDWFAKVKNVMQNADMIGSIWRRAVVGQQHAWIASRPWYTGRAIKRGDMIHFATGGWWTIRTEIVHQWGWPDPGIKHNGGDQMLGELCRQQGYRLCRFEEGVAINADASGICSTAPRRGASENLVGHSYVR